MPLLTVEYAASSPGFPGRGLRAERLAFDLAFDGELDQKTACRGMVAMHLACFATAMPWSDRLHAKR
jgi:hypothetical protein